MRRKRFTLALSVLMVSCGYASAQTPSAIYTWNGTGDIRDWRYDPGGGPNYTLLSNTTPGQLTITEVGDEFLPGCTAGCPVGGAHIFSDNGNRVRESSTGVPNQFAAGGLDLTGLEFIELDLTHNGTADVQVQPFVQTGYAYTYKWFGPAPDYLPSGGAWTIPPNTPTTVRIPVTQLTTEEQAYTRVMGVKVFDHPDQGYLTWTLSEVRSTGTPLTTRIVAPHDVGSVDNGFNGVYANFEREAVAGNDGGQNQSGMSINPAGTGSLQWTDKGTSTSTVSGAAVTWGNGNALNGNAFFERPADFSNYNRLTFRMSATDPLNGGGTLGVQAFFQTGNYEAYRTTSGGAVGPNGEINLPIDGQFHELVFPLNNTPARELVMAFGVNLFTHLNDLNINVDYVRFDTVAGVPGDYNNDGSVEAGDYVLWRKGGPLANEVDTPGTVNAADYTAWRARFGNTSGSGSLVAGGMVPEPAGAALLLMVVAAFGLTTTRPGRLQA
jgi:hypothetical protein